MANWQSVPCEFLYLREMAEKYGHLASIDGLKRGLKAHEIKELGQLASEIGWKNHFFFIESWLIGIMLKGEQYDVRKLVDGLFFLMQAYGLDASDCGPKKEPEHTLQLWASLDFRCLQTDELRQVVSDEVAFPIVVNTLERVPIEDLAMFSWFKLAPFASSQSLDWIESHQAAIPMDAQEVFSPLWYWGSIAAISEFSWDRAKSWMDSGKDLGCVALAAIRLLDGETDNKWIKEARSYLIGAVQLEATAPILLQFAQRESDPRIVEVVENILSKWNAILKHSLLSS